MKRRCNRCLSLESSTWEGAFMKKRGLCEECYLDDKGLVKCGDHYVPWEYQNYCEVENDEQLSPEDFEDANSLLPKISWCSKFKKWKLEFTGTEVDGGYAVDFEWYFDSKEDILKSMGKE